MKLNGMKHNVSYMYKLIFRDSCRRGIHRYVIFSIKDACTISLIILLLDGCDDKMFGANIGLLATRSSTKNNNKKLRRKKATNVTNGLDVERLTIY
jgi:hypothetical protein